MEKLTALLDNSFLRELCELPETDRSRLWNRLVERYQVVLPTILIEEFIASLAPFKCKYPEHIAVMGMLIFKNIGGWLEDVYEMAYRELVAKERWLTLPTVSKQYVEAFQGFDPTNPGTLS